MSRFVNRQPDEAPKAPARRSIYEDRGVPTARSRPWTQVADTNPVTGALEWVPGWERRAQGWVPLDEFLWERM